MSSPAGWDPPPARWGPSPADQLVSWSAARLHRLTSPRRCAHACWTQNSAHASKESDRNVWITSESDRNLLEYW
eukprot:7637782-Pyramimonas_sp.AAC.1